MAKYLINPLNWPKASKFWESDEILQNMVTLISTEKVYFIQASFSFMSNQSFFNMSISRPLFCLFSSFSHYNSIAICKSVDVLRTWGRRMVGTDISTEL